MPHRLTDKLLNWYAENARGLPWRRTDDPYAIWVAEVMLQQTRVETVKPYYRRWMQRFPTVTDLAEASQDEVLNLWEGLGYYRRARYLHRAAKTLVSEYDGQLPTTENTLRELPGIGPYTAAAIASIAFGEDHLALDGNLRRVLARLFDIEAEINSSAAEKKLHQIGSDLLPNGQAGTFNQALMDLGAMICLPRDPRCEICPLQADCLARQRGVERERPVRAKSGELPHVTRLAAALTSQDHVLIGRRPEGALLGGLWEFPGTELEGSKVEPTRLAHKVGLGSNLHHDEPEELGTYEHSYSHYRVTAHAFRFEVKTADRVLREEQELRWVPVGELDDYPMGKIDRSIARDLQDSYS